MKKAVFVVGTLGRFAKRGDAITAEDFKVLADVAEKAELDAELVFAVTDLSVAGKPGKVTVKLIRAERDRMVQEINDHEPELIMAFGPVAAKALFNKGNLVLKEHVREGYEIDDLTATVFCTHSLDQVHAKNGMKKWLILDTVAATNGFTKTEWGNYVVLDPSDPSWSVCPPAFLPHRIGPMVGFDLETYPGLDAWHPDARIRMAIVSNAAHESHVVQLGPDSQMPDWLNQIVEDPAIIKAGSNIKFDYKWLRRFGTRMVNMHDTSTAEHLIDETNPMKDLKSLTFLYAPWLGDYSKEHRQLVAKRGGWEHVADDEQYTYAGGDGESSYCTAQGQRDKHGSRSLSRPFKLSMDLYATLCEVEHNGCCIDLAKNAELDAKFLDEMARLRGQITDVLGPINPGSPKVLAGALLSVIPTLDLTKFDLTKVFDKRWDNSDDEEISTNRATLEREASKHPIIETVLVWRRLSKLYGTYVKNVREKYKAERAGMPCLFTSFRTDITETYRLSSQGPNLQNIPRKPSEGDDHAIPVDLNVKTQYVSRFEGGKFLEADLSQAELRVAAWLSQDSLMMAAVCSGEDIHTTMAAMLLEKDKDDITKDERQNCKHLTFLILYGGGANTLSKQLGVSKAQAKEMMRQYFATFHELDFYINRTKMKVRRELSVEAPFGYRRRFKRPPKWDCWDGWRIERQAWNFLVQNTAACLAFIAMVDLQDEIEKRQLKSRIALQVHDSIGIDCHPDEVELMATLAKQCLEHPDTERYGVELGVPMTADIEVGDSWGDKKPFEFAGGN